MRPIPRHTLGVSLAGLGAVAAYAALAAVQILVLNPLAAAPGLTLAEIHGAMSDAGESLGPGMVLGILGIGVVVAAGIAVSCLVNRTRPIVPAMTFLALLTGGAPAYWVASFGPGMGLADTFAISGADASPWALPLYAVSALAAVGLLVGFLMRAGRVRPASVPV